MSKAKAELETVGMFDPDTGKTADVHPNEIDNMKLAGWRVTADEPEKADDVDATDEELRNFIQDRTGDKPHHRTGRETLVKKYLELTEGK